MVKETAGFGSCVLKKLLLLSPNIGLEASQDCFGEKLQVGNLLKHSEYSSMKIRKPSPVIICTHEPSVCFAFWIQKQRMFKYIDMFLELCRWNI